MSTFFSDNNWQRKIRDGLLKPFYQKFSQEGRFVFADKGEFATLIQKELAVDTIVQGRDNTALAIEEKIVRWKGRRYSAYTLETMTCTVPGRERKGWMHYAKCDYLLYCFEQEDGSVEAHMIPFAPLQKWFFANVDRYRSTVTEQINKTECKIVSIADVWENVKGCKSYTIRPKSLYEVFIEPLLRPLGLEKR
jgi:hypothetical protein